MFGRRDERFVWWMERVNTALDAPVRQSPFQVELPVVYIRIPNQPLLVAVIRVAPCDAKSVLQVSKSIKSESFLSC